MSTVSSAQPDAPASPLQAFALRNLLTYVSLAAGLGAMRMAWAGSVAGAGALLAFAVVADTFDGRFARMFRSTDFDRAFGVQVDSLSDTVAFGAAPVVCTTLLAQSDPGPAWWIVACLYVACAVTRLAFYNLAHEPRGFIGLPVPLAALIWSTGLLFSPPAEGFTAIVATCAAGMVAPIRLPRPRGVGLAIFAAWPVLVFIAHVARSG